MAQLPAFCIRRALPFLGRVCKMNAFWRTSIGCLIVTFSFLACANDRPLKFNESKSLLHWREELSELASYLELQGADGGAIWQRASSIFKLLDEGNNLLASDVRNYLSISLRAWRFEAVADLKRHTEWGRMVSDRSIPKAIVPRQRKSGAAIWDIDFSKSSLIERSYSATQRVTLLVAFHPRCNPCRRAAADISNDPELLRLFRGAGAWAVGIDSNFDMSDLERWESSYKFAPPKVIKDWRAYGAAAPTSTPVFYILNCGRIERAIFGWPPEGRKDELLEAVRSKDIESTCSS